MILKKIKLKKIEPKLIIYKFKISPIRQKQHHQNMGNPSLNIEKNHPAFPENHKKSQKKPKTRKIEKEWKITWFQAEEKVKTKNEHKNKDKTITKSRKNKRNLKTFESEVGW